MLRAPRLGRNAALTKAADAIASEMGLRLLGDVLVDAHEDAYRLRIERPSDPHGMYHVVLLPNVAVESASNVGDLIVRTLWPLARPVCKTEPQWSPYPQ